ncbi:hypothetical protein ANTQUA_LOCUS3850 [Anthophora quadrimaculata]
MGPCKRRTINQNPDPQCRSVSLKSEQTQPTCTSSHIKRGYITSWTESAVLLQFHRKCQYICIKSNYNSNRSMIKSKEK